MISKAIATLGNLLAAIAGLGLLARYVSPADFWPPAIVALLLPLLLLFTLLFVLLQAYRRRWRSLIFPVVVMLFSLPVTQRLFAWPDAKQQTAAGKPTVDIITNNVRVFRDPQNKGTDTSDIYTSLLDRAPDILLLQEASPEYFRKGDNVALLMRGGKFSARHQPADFEIATYTKDSLREVAEATDYGSIVNGFIVSDVNTAFGTLRVINAHLQSNQISGDVESMNDAESVEDRFKSWRSMFRGYAKSARLRARQAEEIRGFIDESPYPVIVAGDFNDVPSSYAYNRILSPRLRDAWAVSGSGLGTTFTGPLPGLRIDFMLVDTSLKVLEVERLPPNWSDHLPLRVKLSR